MTALCHASLTTQLRVVGSDLVVRAPIKKGEVFRNDTLIKGRLSFRYLFKYRSKSCLLISFFVNSLLPSSASGCMDTEKQGERERKRERENDKPTKWASVYRFTYHTAYPIHTSDLIVFHNLALNACHMISKDLPKTTVWYGVFCSLLIYIYIPDKSLEWTIVRSVEAIGFAAWNYPGKYRSKTLHMAPIWCWHAYRYKHMCMYIHIYIYTCVCTHTYTYIHR